MATKKKAAVEAVPDQAMGEGFGSVVVHLEGIVPLLMHNGELADQMNPVTKAMKELRDLNKKKTDDFYAKLAVLELRGGIYLMEGGNGLVPCVPAINIESCIGDGASRINRMKGRADAAAGVWLTEPAVPVIHDGPKNVEALLADPKFCDRRMAVIQRNRIVRHRPKFDRWQLKFEVRFYPELFSAADVVQCLTVAGRYVGLCDYTPRFGRFRVVSPSVESLAEDAT